MSNATFTGCDDDDSWTDWQYGSGTSDCNDVAQNPSWCTLGPEYGGYSYEARRACPMACEVCQDNATCTDTGEACQFPFVVDIGNGPRTFTSCTSEFGDGTYSWCATVLPFPQDPDYGWAKCVPCDAAGTTRSPRVNVCAGDADTFDAGFGDCSTYAPNPGGMSNFPYCHVDSRSDDLLPQQVCPQCGLCVLGTSTTSAHSTTGTSTGTSTTSFHSTTDTSGSSTPHTTTETTATTYTQAPCERSLDAVARAVFFPGAPCMPVNGTCPMECRPILVDAIALCQGSDELFLAWLLIPSLLGAPEAACQEAYIDTLLSSTAPPSCSGALFLLKAPIRACREGDDNASACPEVCDRVMEAAFDRCSANDTIHFGADVAVTAEQLVDSERRWFSPDCSAVLSTKTFLGGRATSTTPAAEEEQASTTFDFGTRSVSSASMETSFSGTTMGVIYSITSSVSSAVAEEEHVSSSQKFGVGPFALSLASLLMLM